MTDVEPCHLLALPAELRSEILETLLLDEDDEDESVVHVADRHVFFEDWHHKTWQPPAILHTCRQLRNEAATIYYAANIFHFSIDSRDINRTLCNWLQALAPETRKSIPTIRLGLMYEHLPTAKLGLELFSESLEKADCGLREDVLVVQVYAHVEDTSYCPNGQPYGEYIWLRMKDLMDRLGVDRPVCRPHENAYGGNGPHQCRLTTFPSPYIYAA
ncbi:hypothetical protein LTR53_007421 [Teratosphaeriaceae sp. CCFEE 6253]|nr:hypothetical protein LTR53_007421 [Teratosphaeriaceae sp. CCFEE 6253]